MKVFIAVLFNVFMIQSGIAQSLLDGLVVHYPLDGDIVDKSGNGHDGSFINANKAIDRFGYDDACFHFNGIDEYIEISNDPELKMYPPFTVSLWVYFDKMFDRGTGLITNDYKEDYYTGFHLGVTPNTKAVSFALGNGGPPSSASMNAFATLKSYSSLGWYHIVVVARSITSASIYIDGVIESTSNSISSNTMFYSGLPGRIGVVDFNNRIGEEGWFKGKIDDVAFWDRELAQDEIYELYQYGIQYPTGIPEFESYTSLRLFPNPSTGDQINVNLSASVRDQAEYFRVYNSIGSLVLESEAANSVDISELDGGLYILQVLDRNETVRASGKFMILD